jgi:hypothetical protein
MNALVEAFEESPGSRAVNLNPAIVACLKGKLVKDCKSTDLNKLENQQQ